LIITGPADALGFLDEGFGRLLVALVARHHRHAGGAAIALASALPPMRRMASARGDELDAGLADGLG
jgi:hypothetical protein